MNQPVRHKSKLLAAFKKAARYSSRALLIFSFGYAAMFPLFYMGRGQKLTPGEKSYVEGIFGREVKTDKVRKFFKGRFNITHLLDTKHGTVLPPTSYVDFFASTMYSPDFSRDTSVALFGDFIHEMTHVWQNQNRAWNLRSFKYTYSLTDSSRFSDFGIEQQASIIEDYARRFLHPAHAESVENKISEKDKPAFYQRLKKVVEDRFPTAQETRLAFEKSENQKYKGPQP